MVIGRGGIGLRERLDRKKAIEKGKHKFDHLPSLKRLVEY